MAILQERGWQKRRKPPNMASDIKRAVASLKAAGKITDGTPVKLAHKLVMQELRIDPAAPPYGLQSSEGVRKAMRAAGIGFGQCLLRAAEEALAIARGETQAARVTIVAVAKDGGDAESNTGS